MAEGQDVKSHNWSSSILTWGNLLRTVVLLSVLIAGIYFLVLSIVSSLKSNHLKILAAGFTIDIMENARIQNVIVDPRGWNDTGIYIHKGDKLNMSASGSINVAMGRMIESLTYEYNIKHRNARNPKIHYSTDTKYFSAEEKKRSLFAYPWNGPEGIDYDKVADSSARKHLQDSEKDRLVPAGKEGQLIAVISPSEKELDISKSQVILFSNKSITREADRDGYLLFIINDIKFSSDPKEQLIDQLTWQDNIGFFNILLAIESKS